MALGPPEAADPDDDNLIVTDPIDLPSSSSAYCLYAIRVVLESFSGDTANEIWVRQTKYQQRYRGNVARFKSTFPLILAYAITGHRSQGATLEGDVIVDVRDAFAMGLMYVVLSRIRTRKNICLVGTLTPEMFQPIKIDGI